MKTFQVVRSITKQMNVKHTSILISSQASFLSYRSQKSCFEPISLAQVLDNKLAISLQLKQVGKVLYMAGSYRLCGTLENIATPGFVGKIECDIIIKVTNNKRCEQR
jgi:hypothetical protein